VALTLPTFCHYWRLMRHICRGFQLCECSSARARGDLGDNTMSLMR